MKSFIFRSSRAEGKGRGTGLGMMLVLLTSPVKWPSLCSALLCVTRIVDDVACAEARERAKSSTGIDGQVLQFPPRLNKRLDSLHTPC